MITKLIIHDDPDLLTERFRALKKLKSTEVKVGLPKSAGGQLHFILAVQEHGSPIMHIPSRPVIHPALAKDETRAEMAKTMKAAIQSAWDNLPFRVLCTDEIFYFLKFNFGLRSKRQKNLSSEGCSISQQ